jgi:hypothetical protein
MAERIKGLSEDWLAVIIGGIVFVLALGPLAGVDLLGWAAGPKTWIDPAKAVQPASESYAPQRSAPSPENLP